MRLIFLMHMPLPGLILTECFMCCERSISVAIHSNGWESGCTGIGGNDFAFVLETQSGLGDPQVSSHWASSVLHVEMRIPLSYIRDHQQTCGSPFGGQACHQ